MNLLSATVRRRGDAAGLPFSEVSASERTGDELIGASLYEFEPGKQLWPYHFHAGNEEWAVVVAGTPTLRTPEGERELAPATSSGSQKAKRARTPSTTAAPRRRDRDLLDAQKRV